MSPEAFLQHAQATAVTSDQCVLRATTSYSVNNFWQGAFSLTRDDLKGTLGPTHEASSAAALDAAGVTDAYLLRKELVNLKKACLRTYHDAQKVLETLQRQDSYFFRDTSSGHVRGCAALPLRADAAVDLDEHRKEYTQLCHTYQRCKGLVIALHDARDFTKFLCSLPRHPDDADRVGGEGLHKRLKAMPSSFRGHEALTHAEALLAVSFSSSSSHTSGGGAAAHQRSPSNKSVFARNPAGGARDDSVDVPDSLPASALQSTLTRVMTHHMQSLPGWPLHVHEFVRLSLIARGGAKALAIRAGCEAYREALRKFQARTRSAVASLTADEVAALARSRELGVATWAEATALNQRVKHSGGGDDAGVEEGVAEGAVAGAPTATAARSEVTTASVVREDADAAGRCRARATPDDTVDPDDAERVHLVRKRLALAMHIHRLTGVCEANGHLLEILDQLLDERRAKGHKLFVAGDKYETAMFYPAEFAAVRDMLSELACSARYYGALQKQAMALEGWPPPAAAMRTRVNLDGDLGCLHCDGHFSKQWVARGVCWQCEEVVRSQGRCPFDVPMVAKGDGSKGSSKGGGKGGSSSGKPSKHYGATFCTHQMQCVVCDGGFAPCPTCRLAQGDGETVAALVGSWRGTRRTVLLYDFDRSLCSTKSGGSPLIGSHSLDADLAEAASTHEMYVVTRNRHKDEILSFLAQKGVPCAGVVVVPKGVSKGMAMLELLPELAHAASSHDANNGHAAGAAGAPEVRAVFVDDTIREVCDEQVAALPGLYRVLFKRGAVGL